MLFLYARPTMKISGDMLVLAREFRDMTQKEVADAAMVAQSTVAKIEAGLKSEISDDLGERFSATLRFPIEFLSQDEELLSYGSSAYFYRKRATMPAADRKRIHSVVNLLRIAVRRFMRFVDVDPTRPLPQFDIEEYGHSAANVAKALRVTWSLPDGPIRDLTALVESAGIIVVPCDFGTRLMDATSLRLSDMPPLVFISASLPGDRWRYTLAHELGHLVMHTVPHERMEIEADEFAGEFLTPAASIKPQLTQVRSMRVRDLAPLKLFWKVSFQMLLMRAKQLGVISPDQAAQGFRMLAPVRMQEPVPIEREAANNFQRVVRAVKDDLNFGLDGVSRIVAWPIDLTRQLLPSSEAAAPKLRLVQNG